MTTLHQSAGIEHWTAKLEDAPSVLQLPADRARPSDLGAAVASVHIPLVPALVAAVEAMAATSEATADEVVLAGLVVLLHRYSDQDDVVVGCTGLGDVGAEADLVITRISLPPGTSFATVLAATTDELRAGAAAGAVRLDELIAVLGAEPGRGKHPFFQVELQVGDGHRPSPGGLAPCDIVLHSPGGGDVRRLRFDYSPSLFDERRIVAMAEHLVVLLGSALDAPARPVVELDLLTEADRDQLRRWNDTGHDHDPTRPIASLFAAQVAQTPDAVALEHGDARLTYAELDEAADHLARALRDRGVGPDTTVAIGMERSVEQVTAVLAVLKAGGAYVPIDLAYPEARRTYMLESSGSRLLLVAEPSEDVAAGAAVDVVSTRELAGAHAGGGSGLEPPATTGEDLGYVIYTSGSTGLPKGVALPQRALTNLVEWQLRRPGFASGARTLQFSSLSFDVSFQELLTTWCSGGALVLIDDAVRRDPRGLLDHIVRNRVERIFLPFVALRGLADAALAGGTFPTSLREVYTAGEQLQVDDTIRAFFEALPDATLENQYGPSESHVVTAHPVTGPPSSWPALPSIGSPVDNTVVHILDRVGGQCPPGVPGELHIGGVCLARGYLGQPERTAERFVAHPLARDGGRLYRTGDRARWAPDGTIEFLGRADDQVKLRGFRIEPGEVGAVLSSFPGVRQCVATVVDVGGLGPRLAAYVVPAEGVSVDVGALHRFARDRLPDYMVPSHVTTLDALPLTPSGKVDLLGLPTPAFDRAILSAAHVSPVSPEERALAGMWVQLLGVEGIGVDDDFFELGGDSLMAVELFAMIKAHFGQELPLGALARQPTIAGLAGALEPGSEERWDSLVPLRAGGTAVPLFCVHGGSGNVTSFPNLADELPDDQPVYALQWDGLDGRRGSRTIPAMARTYLEAVREVQPKGPYRLAGQCVGGLIAREMATVLERAGEDVELLVMYDSPNVFSRHHVVRERLPLLPAGLRTLQNRAFGVALLALDIVKGRNEVERAPAIKLRSALRRRVPQEHRELYGALVMSSATWGYRIRRLDIPTLLIHTGRSNAGEVSLTGEWTDGMLGWSDHASDRFRAHLVSGDHNAIPYEPRSIELLTEALGARRSTLPDSAPPGEPRRPGG